MLQPDRLTRDAGSGANSNPGKPRAEESNVSRCDGKTRPNHKCGQQQGDETEKSHDPERRKYPNHKEKRQADNRTDRA
jgi:hypothetical protein